jgi:deazaflavin-dependent oxidoreductase (nitroreductase family)
MFDPATVSAAETEREISLTTFGRKSGKPSRRIMWITTDGPRLYIRSGQGLVRDWPQNLLANGRAVLHIGDRDVPVRARHVSDPTEARASYAAVKRKYNVERNPSQGDEPLTPAEQATFELLPEDKTPH